MRYLIVPVLAVLCLATAVCEACGPVFFCPVAGCGEAKDKCCCPGGYCPRKATARITVEHQGHPVFLCCSQCIEVFKKEPEKFAANANHQLAARLLAKQVKCPLCGGEARATNAVTMAGVMVHFCSQECKKKAESGKLREQLDMVFGKKAFATAFVVTPAKK